MRKAPRARRIDHTGQTYGSATILEMEGDWRGQRDTYYDVHWACCGRHDRKSQYQITAWVEAPPQKCQWCIRKKSVSAPPPVPVRDPVRENTIEVLGLLRKRERERTEMMERVRARRAQAEAATQAAHRRAMGVA